MLAPLGLASGDGVSYEVRIVGVGGRLADRLEEGSMLVARRDDPPPSVQALRQRARDDRELLERILRSRGWYDGRVEEDVDAAVRPAVVTMSVTRGQRTTLSSLSIEGLPEEAASLATPAGLAGLGVVAGQPALAEVVIAAEARLLAALADRAWPFAVVSSRESRLDRRTRSLDVTLVVDPGPRVSFGEVTVEGLSAVSEDYVRRRVAFSAGEPFSPGKVDATRKALFSSGVFSGVSVGWGSRDDVGPDGRAPVRISVTEGDMHSVGAGVKYSSAEGAGGRAFWENRNATGVADRLRAEVQVTQLVQTGGISYRRPDWLSTGQSLLLDAELDSDKPPAYDRYAAVLSAGVERPFTRRLVGTGGLSIEQSDVNSAADPNGTLRFTLLGVPLGLRYDGSDDALDPTRGHRTLVGATPFFSVLGDDATILVARATESVYVPLVEGSRRVIWASRFSVGSVVGQERNDLPADKRFYAGGGDSVRGYRYQFVGPVVDVDPFSDNPRGRPDFKPVGGRSLLQFGTELRWKVSDNFGVVPFVEGAGVYEASYPDFGEEFRWAAGLGLRYFTVAGPIRLDLAFPINPQDVDAGDPPRRFRVDDFFQVYISLGQAF